MSKKVDNQKKYWWVIFIIVPLVVAAIGVIPPLLNAVKPTPSPLPQVVPITNNKFASDLYFITEVRNAGDAARTQDVQQAVQRATSLVQNANYANAISVLEQAAAQYQLPTIYNNLGVLYANAGNLPKAQEAYQNALKIDPNDQVANYNLGLLKQAQGKPEEAASYFDKAPGLKKSTEANATPPSLVESTTQIPGVKAQLFGFTRFQNTITAKVRLINSSANDVQIISPTHDSHLLDEATHSTYRVTDETSFGVTVPANGSVEIWGKYDVLPNDKPEYLSAALGSGILFEHIAVSK